ncbi:MAG: tyrosine-type recombinase/integrase [Pyrinomonadaceae bacterium]
MKIATKYISQGYFADSYKERTIRKGEYRYRAVFAIFTGKDWKVQSNTKGLFTKDIADGWLKGKVDEFKAKGAKIMLNPDTVKGFVESHYKPYLRDHQQIQYEFEFQKLDVICAFLGEFSINDVSILDVLAFKSWLLQRPYRRGKGEKLRGEASANRYLSRLRALLNFAEESGKRKDHISFKNIIRRSAEAPKTAYISFEEFMRALDACYQIPKCNRWKRDRSHLRLTLIAGYTTGWRIGELAKVTRGMITTDDEKRIGVIRLAMPNTRNKIHTKTVDISTWLYDELEAAGVFQMDDKSNVFNTTNYYNLVKDIFVRAKVSPDVTFHTLRAANATERDTAGQDRQSIQAGMGHATGSDVTERHYLRHQDYHVIEKGTAYNEKLQKMLSRYSSRRVKDALDADIIE